MYVGYAFYNREVPGVVPRHLNVVARACKDQWLVLNITTGNEGEGRTFTGRDWRKIDRPSRVAASQARLVSPRDLRALRDGYLMQETEDCPPLLVKAMLVEFLSSTRGNKQLKNSCI